jgi:NADH:ubiquinone oxidoreductase subunit F (NADH-binding)
MRFFLHESCGKCTPCREGAKRMYEILTRITEGRGEEADLEKLRELGHVMHATSLCGLGESAPNHVVSTIKHFEYEYLAHIRHKVCPQAGCKALAL